MLDMKEEVVQLVNLDSTNQQQAQALVPLVEQEKLQQQWHQIHKQIVVSK